MVKILVKSIFVTGSSEYQGLPLPQLLLPENISDQYLSYYRYGSGSVLLYLIVAITLYHAVFSVGIERTIARLLLLLACLVYIQDFEQVISTSVYLTPFGIPALNLPISILYLLVIPALIVMIISFRNQMHLYISRKVVRLFDLHLILLLLFTTLPLYSGELWN